MENNRVMIFIGSFLFGFSIILIILATMFVKQIDATANKENYFEAFIGWLGATVIGGAIALKNYVNASGGMGYAGGDQEVGDSIVSFVLGLSIALYALLGAWLYIVNVSTTVIVICMVSSALSYIGLIMVSYFAMQN